MTEAEILKLALDAGGPTAAVLIIGIIYLRQTKTKDNTQGMLVTLLKNDQTTRERQTEALTSLTAAIGQLNQVTGANQRDCAVIREAYTIEVGKLADASDQCKKAGEICAGVAAKKLAQASG